MCLSVGKSRMGGRKDSLDRKALCQSANPPLTVAAACSSGKTKAWNPFGIDPIHPVSQSPTSDDATCNPDQSFDATGAITQHALGRIQIASRPCAHHRPRHSPRAWVMETAACQAIPRLDRGRASCRRVGAV